MTLIHGWEGSIDSAYILSASAALFARGYNVFRLNLRDHGDSHHLNREFFNSTRITEVIEALKAIQQLFPHQRNYLTGFSLGGNFALRIGQKIPNELSITKIVAVCPLIDPLRSTRNLQDNHFFYHRYFVKKWKRSIRKKLNLHKGLVDQSRLLNLNSLTAMHDYFVPRHTPFLTTNDYFAGYKIEAKDFKKSSTQILIIAAEDDPITRKSDYKTFGQTDQLNIEWQRFGGHCGFLQDINLTSWVDRKLVHTFEQSD